MIAVLSAASVLLVDKTSQSAERSYLKKSETFCATGHSLCLVGSLWYEPNSRLLSLNARIEKQTGPGTIRITFVGSSRLNVQRRTELNVSVRGAHSEIIDHQMRPDAPDVYEWRIDSFAFTPKLE